MGSKVKFFLCATSEWCQIGNRFHMSIQNGTVQNGPSATKQGLNLISLLE